MRTSYSTNRCFRSIESLAVCSTITSSESWIARLKKNSSAGSDRRLAVRPLSTPNQSPPTPRRYGGGACCHKTARYYSKIEYSRGSNRMSTERDPGDSSRSPRNLRSFDGERYRHSSAMWPRRQGTISKKTTRVIRERGFYNLRIRNDGVIIFFHKGHP